ncbi:CHAT domain-containing protein [Mycolicibacterium iranicum]|uniref:Uncharacterized protein n=1 Tax=Mycolicibacterium iranicum TaxID=912594 RepID=A0A178M1S4_MYCIR|nr:CHAT domain-containing protein [Mycolicibacterium iranicum]OAN41938.1 hypothetical protein A4X20_03725 [Mycolicibacterium iranicum]
MECTPAIIIRAASTVRTGLSQLEHSPDDAEVVVVDDSGRATQYYTFGVADVRARLSAHDPDATVFAALRLDEAPDTLALQLGDDTVEPGGIVLNGDLVVGIASGDVGEVFGGGGPMPEFTTFDDGFAPPTADLTLRGPELIEEDLAVFRAYPDVDAPAQVSPGQEFAVVAGFAAEPADHMEIAGPPVLVTTGPRPDFRLQILGFGFRFPDGIERTLTVDRDHPDSSQVRFTVIADPGEAAARRMLEISYEYAGVVVGRTWATVEVVAQAPAEPAERAAIGASGLIGEVPPGEAPHMSIDITTRGGDATVHWRFHCRYPDVVRPGAVTTTLTQGSAQAFAEQLMRQLPNTLSGPLLSATVRGVGDEVADNLPAEFWDMFENVWRRAEDAGDEPRLLITTSEPWVPWELAWIEPERLRHPELLPPEFSHGATLGQLWQVSRWTMPTRQLPGGAIPVAPPPLTIEADAMVVIKGEYTGAAGLAALPHAEEEADTIAQSYGALSVSISQDDVAALMECTLQRDGADFLPTMLHFAGHAETDVNHQQFTGLKLAGGARLNPLMVRGFHLLARQRPFVFLNACEAGAPAETLTQLGGLAGAFLREGTRGFVAPLWKVNDVEARDIALEFYRRTLDEGETVGEAMRAIRRRYTTQSNTASAIAYVFYGNPDLRLERSTR